MSGLKAKMLVISVCVFVPAIITRPVSELPSRCVIHAESLDYSYFLRTVRASGTVILRISIDETGHVKTEQQVGGRDDLALEAARNVRTWLFAPGEPTTMEVRYDFRLDPPGTSEKVPTKVVFDFPSHVLVISRERESDHL